MAQETHPQYDKYRSIWKKIRDVFEGEDVIKAAGKTYLPAKEVQEEVEYRNYLSRSNFLEVLSTTITANTGLATRKDPEITLPDTLAENETFINQIKQLIQDLITEILAVGRAGVLIEPVDGTDITIPPRYVIYQTEDIVNWGGFDTTPTGVILRDGEEYVELAFGPEGYTVYFLDKDGERKISTFIDQESGEEFTGPMSITPTLGANTLNEIPFTFFNVTDNKLPVQKPPSLPLVNMSLSYYRDSADYQNALHLSASPTPIISGPNIDEKKLRAALEGRGIGSSRLIVLPKDSVADFLEFSGQGLSAQRQALKDKESLMRAMGASLFTEDSQLSTETATSARIRQGSQTSILVNVIKTVETGVEIILKQTARWMGLSDDDVNVTLPKDIVDPKLTPQEVKEVIALYQANVITHETLYNTITQGEFIASTRTAEEERDEIEDENAIIE